MAPVFFSVFLALLGPSPQPALQPHPLRLPGGGLTFDRVVRAGESLPPTTNRYFHVVDRLGHHDDFWSNILVGDADHDQRQEIVLRIAPGLNSFVFYEDNGMGQFDEVHAIPEPDGGLLAMGDVDGDGLTDLFFERGLGFCNDEFVRMEASSPFGFPDHVVWTGQKQGNVVDFRATIADVDGDSVLEFVTSDDDFFCSSTTLKVFESAPGDQMNLTLNHGPFGWDLGNPVVADFDLDGRQEIVVSEGLGGRLHVFEGIADDTIVYSGSLPHPMSNAYQLALVDAFSPDSRPIAFLAGQMQSLDYRVQSYEMLADNSLSKVNETPVPNNCGASIPQITAADLSGSPTAEIVLDRLCDPVPIYSVDVGGALILFDVPVITESLEIAATRQTPVHADAPLPPGRHSGAIVVGTFPNDSNPQGQTLVLERRVP